MIYARTDDNGWPVDMRPVPFPESNITFDDDAAFTEYCAANAHLAPPNVEVQTELTDAEIWAEKLAGGWVDPVTSIKLKTNEAARNLFQGQSGLMREAVELGSASNDTPVSIWDFYEQEHVLSLLEMRLLLLRYGFAWKAMFDEFAP